VPLAQALADWAAETYAPLPVSFEIRQIDHKRLTIEDILIGDADAVDIDRIDIGFTIDGLRAHRVDSIAVEGVSIPVAAGLNGTVRIAGIDLAAGGQSPKSDLTLPDWTIEKMTVNGIAATATIDGTIDIDLSGDMGATQPLALAALPLDDPFSLVGLIDGALSIAIDAKTGASLLSGLPLTNVTATGALALSIAEGRITVTTGEPVAVRSDQGSVDITIDLNGDGVIRSREDVAGTVSARFELIRIPVPELEGNKAFLTGFATADIADGMAKIRVGRGSSTGVSGLPFDTSGWPEPFREFGIGFTVAKDLTATLPLSGLPDTLEVDGDLIGTYGPLYATLHGPTTVTTQDTVTLSLPRIDLDMLKGELFGRKVKSLNRLTDFTADLSGLTASGMFETDTTVIDDGTMLDAKLTARLGVSQTGADLTPSRGGRIAYTAGTSAIEVELAGAESDRITVELDPQVIDGKLSLATLTVNHDGTAIDLSGSAVTVRHAADTGTLTAVAPALFVNGLEMLAGPVTLNATVKQSEAGNTLDGTLTTAPGLSAQFHAYHTEKVPVIHTVTANLQVAPLTFEEGGLQPSDVFPFFALSGPFSGIVSSRTDLVVDLNEPPTGLITLHLKDANFRNPVFAFSNISETLELPIEHLPGSRPDQVVSGAISAGPLEDAPFRMVYTIHPDLGVDVKEVTVGGFGGSFGLKNLSVQADRTAADGTIFLDAVDFEVLTRVADIEGFHADGVLSGNIPFAIRGDQLVTQKGKLRALGSGRLTYTSPSLDAAAQTDSQMELLVEALRDFHYNALSLDLELPENGDGSLLLNLQGNNPDVLDGHPFDINVNLESNFNKLANDLYKIYEQATGFVSRAAN